MGILKVRITDDLEKRVRSRIVEKSKTGYKKGDLSRATEEALELWLERELWRKAKEANK